MDSEITSPAIPDPLAAMLQNATIDNAERSDFSNSARDTIKVTVNNYNFPKEGENHESSDALNHILKAINPFLEEIRRKNQSQFTVGETSGADGSESQSVTPLEGDPVDVIDIVPPEPSLLPVASVADLYTRSMLKCLVGYALYEPQPLSELSMEYLRHGINIGDVGFVRGDGVFDFLFNVCPSKNRLINPPMLSDGFSLETLEHSATRTARALPRKTRLFQSPVTRTKSGGYVCEGSEGAILELPEGAIQEEAMNILPFKKLAARHGVQWYKYTMTRGREISNGSLYIITSFTKCAQWGIAVFDRKCAPGQGLKFNKKISLPFGKSISSKYHWKGSHTFHTKISESNLNQGDPPNQCVFLRGYKIMIRHDIFDDLCNGQPRGSIPTTPSSSSQAGSISLTRDRATRIRGGGGSDSISKRLTDGGLLSWTKMPSMTMSDEVVLHANFNSSLVHPSDLINAALLRQNPGAKVALTHDDVWCDLLRDNFPIVNYTTLISTAQLYTNNVDEYDCVSLGRISDLSNVLNESSNSLEGTETPALQGSLTTPNEDLTPVLATISPTLPRELVERIFHFLDTKSILTCRLVNRVFNEIIRSSMFMYFLACKAAGVIDNSRSQLSYAKQFDALLKREDAWRELKPVFEMTIKVDYQTAFYGLTGGIYILSDRNQRDLHYCHLPSSPEDNPQWISFPAHGPEKGRHGTVIGFGTSLPEHDLIINFISSDTGNQAGLQRYSLDMVLLKLSTGEYHPLARHPRIHVQRLPSIRPRIAARIVGDNIALIVPSQSQNTALSDQLFIFDWKTGHKRLQHEATVNSYSNSVFVSPELLLVPNLILSHFEVWHLPSVHPDPEPPVQILSLKTPAISPDYSIRTFDCNGDHSPFLHSMQYFSSMPFLYTPESSIIIASLRMSSRSTFSRRQYVSYTLVIDRRALLDTIQKLTSPSLLEQREDLPTWLTNEITVHKIADLDDASVRLSAQSKLVSMIPHARSSPQPSVPQAFATSQTSATLHIPADSFSSSIPSGSSTTSSKTRSNFLRVEWADWAPTISRWLTVQGSQAGWVQSFAGQRYAFTVPSPRVRGRSKVVVTDFNPHNFRRSAEMVQVGGEGENYGARGNHAEEELEMLRHGGVFSEEIYMGLKCVVYHTPDDYDFEAVLMDEERLLGLKLLRGNIREIKVLYIG